MTIVRVSILAEAGFVPTELALVQDVLRIAGRLEPDCDFVHQVCTTQSDNLVEGMGGTLVRAVPFETNHAPLPNYVVVLGGQRIAAAFRDIKTRLQWMARMGVRIVLLSDAAAEWKRLNGHAVGLTTHWENDQLERDAGRSFSDRLPLFVQRSRITTGGGMASTADLILKQIIEPHSVWLAQSVAQMLLLGDIRDGMTHQPRSENDVMALEHVKLAAVISAMEEAMEAPLTTTELAKIAGFSVRQMERKFRAILGRSPVAYYRSLRLRRAKRLVEQTTLPISEISIACGFGTFSNFSRKYAQEFGLSPSKQRAQLSTLARIPPAFKHQGTDNASSPFSPRPPRASIDTPGTHETPVQRAGR